MWELSIAYCENVKLAIFYWPGVVNVLVVYGTAWVTRTFAFATLNYREPHELANVVLWAVTTLDVIICEPEPFTRCTWTTPVAALFGRSLQENPVVVEPFMVTVYTYWVITDGSPLR